MSIVQIEQAKELRWNCERIGREGMYKEALRLARLMLEADRTPQDVMIGVGRMRALAVGSKADFYWHEKVQAGYFAAVDEAQSARRKFDDERMQAERQER